jgi:hypothetical protein
MRKQKVKLIRKSLNVEYRRNYFAEFEVKVVLSLNLPIINTF